MIQCDAAQLEWRTAVELSSDPVGIKELNDPSVDTHANNQAELNLPSRLISKIFLFRTIFRGTGWSFAHDPDFSHVSTDPKYWDERNERFYIKYDGLNRIHHDWAMRVTNKKPIVSSITGREWFIPMKQKENRWKEIELVIPWTLLSNYPVQGTGADIMTVARVSLNNRLKRYKIPATQMVATVHDSLVADCDDKVVKDVATIMYEVFDDLEGNIKKLFKYELRVPFPCEVKYGPNLKDSTKLPRHSL